MGKCTAGTRVANERCATGYMAARLRQSHNKSQAAELAGIASSLASPAAISG